MAVSGSGGHKQTFALACALTWGFELDEQTAFEILAEWNVGCMPPWSERELRHKVQQSLKVSHQKPRGHLLGDSLPAYPARQYEAPKAEKAVWRIARRQPRQIEPAVSEISDRNVGKLTPEDWTALLAIDPPVNVPGCAVPRPSEIEVDDDTWRAVEASGFAEEPMVQFALQMFGPGCQVISEENAR